MSSSDFGMPKDACNLPDLCRSLICARCLVVCDKQGLKSARRHATYLFRDTHYCSEQAHILRIPVSAYPPAVPSNQLSRTLKQLVLKQVECAGEDGSDSSNAV